MAGLKYYVSMMRGWEVKERLESSCYKASEAKLRFWNVPTGNQSQLEA